MQNKTEEYLNKLMAASKEKNPLKMAIIAYHAFRDSPVFMLSEIPKGEYNILALDAIIRMAHILQEIEWEEDKIKEFLIKSKELAGLE